MCSKRWAAAARRGEITGVIIAGLGLDQLDGDTLIESVNVDARERAVLVTELSNARLINVMDVNLFE
ncbi:hypothetical protein WG8_3968 [Paenibacillus sp. Aloe-11]|nr:hypothetical protein WG8_3968 [Paenibacillus sp. Aloe-11]